MIQAAGGGADSLFIRGFYYDSGDYGLNGLYGIAPYYSTGANFVERVEVLEGPSALLNGMTTGGTGVDRAAGRSAAASIWSPKARARRRYYPAHHDLCLRSRSSARPSTSAGATARTRSGVFG